MIAVTNILVLWAEKSKEKQAVISYGKKLKKPNMILAGKKAY